MLAQSKSPRRLRQGYALLFTIIFLATVLMIFAGMMHWTATNARIIQRNNQFNMSQAAAESATERVLASVMRDFLDQTVTNAAYYASLQVNQTNADGTPWPVRYVFSDTAGNTGRISVVSGPVQSVLEPINSQYPNLRGYPCFWTNTATATPIGQPFTVPATVRQVINMSTVPAFQYAIFYNIDLEMDPGADMTINGPVWSNAGLWAGTSRLTFNAQVSAVNQANISTTDPFCSAKTDSTAPPVFKMAGQPTSSNSKLTIPIAGSTNNNPTNITAWLNIPPPAYAMGTAAGYTTNALNSFLANNSDLIISNSIMGTNYGSLTPYGTNITIWFQNQYNTASYLTKLTPDFYILKRPAATGLTTNFVSYNLSDTNRCYTNVYYAGWSFLTNETFYDFRERDTVQAVQFNVGLFNKWLTNQAPNGGYSWNEVCKTDHSGRQIDSAWIYSSVPRTGTVMPAVRMINGIQLAHQWGLNIVTPLPIYVLGDYNKQIDSTHVSSGTNTANTRPAALMGDAVTIVSANWNDGWNSSTGLGSRTPVATTVNAACLEGIVPSSGSSYSGGVENFLRFMEDWGGTVTYNGSIVVMFPSVYATNKWPGTGTTPNCYNAPTRAWGFDFNFTDPNKLPRLTPQLKKLVRYTWSAN